MAYVLVNSEAASFYQTQTDNFIAQREYYRYVCNDYVSSSVSNGVVRLQFQPPDQRPVIVVINAVTNSPSHEPFELLINEGHYRQTDYTADILRWRQVIDAVAPPPPPASVLMNPQHDTASGNFAFTVSGSPDRFYELEISTNLIEWSVLASNLMDGQIFTDTNTTAHARRFYRLRE